MRRLGQNGCVGNEVTLRHLGIMSPFITYCLRPGWGSVGNVYNVLRGLRLETSQCPADLPCMRICGELKTDCDEVFRRKNAQPLDSSNISCVAARDVSYCLTLGATSSMSPISRSMRMDVQMVAPRREQ